MADKALRKYTCIIAHVEHRDKKKATISGPALVRQFWKNLPGKSTRLLSCHGFKYIKKERLGITISF